MEKSEHYSGICSCNAIVYYVITIGVYMVKIISVAIKAKKISNQKQLIQTQKYKVKNVTLNRSRESKKKDVLYSDHK